MTQLIAHRGNTNGRNPLDENRVVFHVDKMQVIGTPEDLLQYTEHNNGR